MQQEACPPGVLPLPVLVTITSLVWQQEQTRQAKGRVLCAGVHSDWHCADPVSLCSLWVQGAQAGCWGLRVQLRVQQTAPWQTGQVA